MARAGYVLPKECHLSRDACGKILLLLVRVISCSENQPRKPALREVEGRRKNKAHGAAVGKKRATSKLRRSERNAADDFKSACPFVFRDEFIYSLLPGFLQEVTS